MNPPKRHTEDWEKGLRAREIQGVEWEAHKQYIKELYLADGMRLKDLRRLMYERHGFYAKETQYKKRLSTVWNIQKNIPTKKMSAIIQIEARRKLENKETVFAWHKKPISDEKIERSKKRFSEKARYSAGSNKTPSSVTYWTPKSFTPVTAHDFAGSCSGIPEEGHWLVSEFWESFMEGFDNVEVATDSAHMGTGVSAGVGDVIAPFLPHASVMEDEVFPYEERIDLDSEPKVVHIDPSEMGTDASTRVTSPNTDRLFGHHRVRMDNPETLEQFHQLAICHYNNMNNYDAFRTCQQVLRARDRVLGQSNPATLASLRLLGQIASAMRDGDAPESFAFALDERDISLWSDKETLATVYMLGICFYNGGCWEKATQWLRRALDGRILMRDNDLQVLDCIRHLTRICLQLGQLEKALEWLQEEVRWGGRSLWKASSDEIRENLRITAMVCVWLGQQAEAADCIRQLHHSWSFFGRMDMGVVPTHIHDNHPEILRAQHDLGVTFNESKHYVVALRWFEMALHGREHVLGKKHSDTKETKAYVIRLHMETQLESVGPQQQSAAKARREEYLLPF